MSPESPSESVGKPLIDEIYDNLKRVIEEIQKPPRRTRSTPVPRAEDDDDQPANPVPEPSAKPSQAATS
eukprot:3165250-Pyramimonas_sp.AAC.1